ncbi:MAG: SDR family oxidoreductase [Acidobacteriaceae bacterium]
MPRIEADLESSRLTGKRAIITGGASGIGRAIATLFSENGADVVVLDLKSAAAEKTATALGRGAIGVGCDISNTDEVAATFASLTQSGRIDVLVNSAGISHIGTLLTTGPEEFDRLFRVNVHGTFLAMQASVEHMKTHGGGVILNLASVAATAGLPDRFAYSMTKGAVLAMTLSVARDYLADEIRCNCISPARVHTPFVDDFVSRNYPGREEEMYAKLSMAQPIGRMGQPEEIASLALYLCSDEAKFVTGSNFPIDGGFLNLR